MGFKKIKMKFDGWLNVLTGLGMRGLDKKESAAFVRSRYLQLDELDAIYISDGLGKQIINSVAQDMMRQGWEIEGDPSGKINAYLESINFYKEFTTLIKWARLYGGGITVLGINDGRPLDQPVNPKWVRSIDWAHTYDCYSASILDGIYDPDLNSPNYGKPSFYYVIDIRTGVSFTVHYTRVLRLDWNMRPIRETFFNRGWGDGVFQSAYDQLRNLQTVQSNIATMTQDYVTKILKVKGLAEMLASDSGGDDSVMRRAHVLNMTMGTTNTAILDTEETFEKITTTLTGLPETVDRFMMMLSAATKIPVALLFGRSAAGFNATGDLDIRAYYDYIHQEQEAKLAPLLERLIELMFLAKNFDTSGIDPNWKVTFNPLHKNTEGEEAEIRHRVAETDRIYLDTQVLDPSEVAESRFGDGRWSMNTNLDTSIRRSAEDLEVEEEKAHGDPQTQTTG